MLHITLPDHSGVMTPKTVFSMTTLTVGKKMDELAERIGLSDLADGDEYLVGRVKGQFHQLVSSVWVRKSVIPFINKNFSRNHYEDLRDIVAIEGECIGFVKSPTPLETVAVRNFL